MKIGIVALLLLAACAPHTQTVGTPFRNAALTNSAFIMADASRLPMRVWPARQPAAVILGVHGFNDYSRAFELPGPWFAERNIAFYAYDQRGFGEAPGHGTWAGTDVMVGDLKSVVTLLKARHPQTPIFVLGTSMGGALTIAAAADGGLAADGTILVAPAVWGWSSMNEIYQAALWLSAHAVPEMTLTGRGLGRQASDNIEMLRALGADPLVIKETRIDSIYGLVGLMDRAYLSVEKVTLPTLLLYGERDEIVPGRAVENAVSRFTTEVSVKTYPDGWHMLLRDHQRETVWRDILAWVKLVARPLDEQN